MSKVFLSTWQTLSYADIFSCPLTKRELWQRLIEPPKTSGGEWEKKLKKWILQKRIAESNGYYFLPGREKIVKQRQLKERSYRQKLPLVKKAAKLLTKIPTLWFAGLTGSMGVGAVNTSDDIDLMIIAAPGTLWLTRLLIYLLLKPVGIPIRRPRDKEISNKLCFNLFLEASNLKLGKEYHNLFIAYEILLLKPLVDKSRIYQRFLAANQWVKKFLPHAFAVHKRYFPTLEVNPLFWGMNLFCFCLQRFYMRGKPKAKRMTLSQVFFHPQDRSAETLRSFILRTS